MRVVRGAITAGLAIAGLASAMSSIGCGDVRPAKRDDVPRAEDAAGVDRNAEATATAIGVAQRLGQTPAAAARANIRIKQPDQDAQTFQLYLWCAPDGRVRVNATKVDVEFCSALVAADGTYTAWLPRAKLSAHGNLRGGIHGGDTTPRADQQPSVQPSVQTKERKDQAPTAAETQLLLQLTMIASELTAGPLPLMGPFHAGAKKDTITCPAGGGLVAELDIDASERVVDAKRLLQADGKQVVSITYSRYKQFDEQRRPTQARVAVAGDLSEIIFTIGRFDGLPAISDERMRLEPPSDARDVPLDEFLQHLGD